MPFKLSELQIPPPADENQLESLCLDLYRGEFGKQTQKNGRRGQPQNGVDIFVPDKDIGIQCKKRDYNGKIKKQELLAEVKKAKKFVPALKKFILATTCKRDAKIQEEARLISEQHKGKNLFSVQVHSWEEIKELLDNQPEVYKKYYPAPSNISPIIKSVQSESSHQELSRVGNLIDSEPKTAIKLLEEFKKEKWEYLKDKEKYRVLNHLACAKININQEFIAFELLIKALQFDKTNEEALANCAVAYFYLGDIENSKKHIKEAQNINPLNISSHALEIKIKEKEKQSIREIISSLPSSLKEKPEIAYTLSHISIKKKQYDEAKKWLNIFKKQKGSYKNIRFEAGYADMSLHLILERPEVFSGRSVPEDLKDKLHEIIQIYKKLMDQYAEFSRSQANLHLHYALALELNGEINKAIFALKTGSNFFPKDDHLKIELSRLFRKKGDIKKSISLLEKQNRAGKFFILNLNLADLYFQNQQQNKAWELLDKTIKDPSTSNENRLEAQQYQVFRQINFGKIKEAEKTLNLFSKEDQDNVSTLILKSKIENAKEKAKQQDINSAKIHKDKKIKYLKKAFEVFKDKKYKKERGSQEGPYMKSREWLSDIQQLAQELYHCKMYKEAEPLLEEITKQNLNHPEIFKLLNTYFENGNNRLAIELAEKLLKKFPNRIEPAHLLFCIYESLGDKTKALLVYEDFFKAKPQNNFVRIELSIAYINNGQTEKAKKLLNYSFDLNELTAEQISRLSFAYMKTGQTKKALEIQYQNIKKNPKDMEVQKWYFNLILFLNQPKLSDFQTVKLKENKPEDKLFLHPEKVALDCYVRIQDQTLEETEIIIEDMADIYTPDHELSQKLLGKKKGDNILFSNKKYQIMEVKSKYIHKHHEIINKAEIRFGSKAFLTTAVVSQAGDRQDIFKNMMEQIAPNMQQQKVFFKKIFQLYREGRLTIGSIAQRMSHHPIDIIGYLYSSTEDKFISAIPEWEMKEKTKDYLEDKKNVLIDLSSLIGIHQLKMEECLENSPFRFYICPSTISSLERYMQEWAFHSKDGYLTVGLDEKGELLKNFTPADRIIKDLKFWAKVKTWAEKHCKKKPLSSDFVLDREKRMHWEQVIGKEFLDPLLALYDEGSFVFLSEDAILRKVAQSFYQKITPQQSHSKNLKNFCVRLFDLIEYLERNAIIEKSQATQFKADLVAKLNQSYIPIDDKILLFLLKSAEYSVSDWRFQKALFFLGPVSELQGVISITANFLIELYQEPSLLPYQKQIITNELLGKISFGREDFKQIAYWLIQATQIRTRLLPILQNEIYSYIMEWLKGKPY